MMLTAAFRSDLTDKNLSLHLKALHKKIHTLYIHIYLHIGRHFPSLCLLGSQIFDLSWVLLHY